ncbi:MAG: sugar transferase [Pseudomonadota bacterium]
MPRPIATISPELAAILGTPDSLRAANVNAELVYPAAAQQGVSYRRVGKRVLELALILLALPVVLPVIALVAILVACDGHRPFYVQKRVGEGGRNFDMLKLRTMVPNAAANLDAYLRANPEAAAEWAADQKLKNDPRVTRIGHFLRKTSLDELPQLFNVLNGTMSLVGPRPMMPCQKDSYGGSAYYRLKPGITGLWQISDRNECEFSGRASYDELYDRVLSLRLDVAILIRTVGVVLRGTGY